MMQAEIVAGKVLHQLNLIGISRPSIGEVLGARGAVTLAARGLDLGQGQTVFLEKLLHLERGGRGLSLAGVAGGVSQAKQLLDFGEDLSLRGHLEYSLD